mgnify:CR=1 FL=1|tara:strand:- start:2991 stop:3437 length:447 start_codon:yes stop_codon:yes gene_type:complete
MAFSIRKESRTFTAPENASEGSTGPWVTGYEDVFVAVSQYQLVSFMDTQMDKFYGKGSEFAPADIVVSIKSNCGDLFMHAKKDSLRIVDRMGTNKFMNKFMNYEGLLDYQGRGHKFSITFTTPDSNEVTFDIQVWRPEKVYEAKKRAS